MKYPSQEYLKECLSYDPETGHFTWKARPEYHFKTHRAFKIWNKRFSGEVAGNVHSPSRKRRVKYITIRLSGHLYKAHRLAFLCVTGSVTDEIDHANGDGTDNRWCNISESTRIGNCRNFSMSKLNKSGFTGVSWNKTLQKWHAKICNKHIGYFSKIEDAINARKLHSNKLGFSKRHGEVRS